MRRLLALLLVLGSTGCIGLPNPQSEWLTSDGSVQRSTLDDPTIAAGSTAPDFGDWEPGQVHFAHDRSGASGTVHGVGHVGHVGHAGHSGGGHSGGGHCGGGHSGHR